MAQNISRNLPVLKSVSAVSIVAVLGVVMSGCAPEPNSALPSASAKASHSATPKNTSTVSATPTSPSIVGEATGYTCDNILTLQELFDFNQNYYYDSSDKSGLGTKLGSQTKALNGITCVYASQSDGAPIELSLAKIQGDGISQVKTELSTTQKQTTAYGQEPNVYAYFSTEGDLGTVNVLIGNYWLSGSSASFGSPEDATKFLDPVIKKLS